MLKELSFSTHKKPLYKNRQTAGLLLSARQYIEIREYIFLYHLKQQSIEVVDKPDVTARIQIWEDKALSDLFWGSEMKVETRHLEKKSFFVIYYFYLFIFQYLKMSKTQLGKSNLSLVTGSLIKAWIWFSFQIMKTSSRPLYFVLCFVLRESGQYSPGPVWGVRGLALWVILSAVIKLIKGMCCGGKQDIPVGGLSIYLLHHSQSEIIHRKWTIDPVS